MSFFFNKPKLLCGIEISRIGDKDYQAILTSFDPTLSKQQVVKQLGIPPKTNYAQIYFRTFWSRVEVG